MKIIQVTYPVEHPDHGTTVVVYPKLSAARKDAKAVVPGMAEAHPEAFAGFTMGMARDRKRTVNVTVLLDVNAAKLPKLNAAYICGIINAVGGYAESREPLDPIKVKVKMEVEPETPLFRGDKVAGTGPEPEPATAMGGAADA